MEIYMKSAWMHPLLNHFEFCTFNAIQCHIRFCFQTCLITGSLWKGRWFEGSKLAIDVRILMTWVDANLRSGHRLETGRRSESIIYIIFRVWILLRRDILDTTLRDKVFQWPTAGQLFSPDTLVSSTNKTDSRYTSNWNIVEMALNTINLKFCFVDSHTYWYIDLIFLKNDGLISKINVQ